MERCIVGLGAPVLCKMEGDIECLGSSGGAMLHGVGTQHISLPVPDVPMLLLLLLQLKLVDSDNELAWHGDKDDFFVP